MLASALLVLAIGRAALDSPVVVRRVVEDSSIAAPATLPMPLDTPAVRRRHAVTYSDLYYTRLTIHRYGSYAMLPMFGAEYVLGQKLINDEHPGAWLRPTHGAVASGIGALFVVNSVTGAWNLWDSRDDPSNRGLRITHTVLMLASDAGFAITGALTPQHQDFDFATLQSERTRHRNWAIGSMAVSTVGTALMWFWKQ
jgi:hypothetical protein